MDKQTFIRLMKELVELKRIDEKMWEVVKEMTHGEMSWDLPRHEELIVQAIEAGMDDKDKWISHWIYELDCGKEAGRLPVTDKDGKKIPLKTLSQLYDAIIKYK